MNSELIPQAKQIISESLVANVTELFLDLLSNDRYKNIIDPEIDGAPCWQYWIVEPSFADHLIANYPEEIIFFFYGLLIWGRQARGSAIYLDDLIQDIAQRQLEQQHVEQFITLGDK